MHYGAGMLHAGEDLLALLRTYWLEVLYVI